MKRKTKLIIWLVIGVILSLGPIWGIVGTVVGMIMTFARIQQGGMAEPEVLANDVSITLITTAAGFLMCPVGIVIIIVSAIKLGNGHKEIKEGSQQPVPGYPPQGVGSPDP